MTTKHLDIGCGGFPRNPYHRDETWAVDTRDMAGELSMSRPDIRYAQCNFVTDPLPFADHTFESVSAYDVIEHIPRQMYMNGAMAYPFINLMNEIYRVLKPGGLFLATIPGYPHPEAFQDPTHVNIVTQRTAEYFSGSSAPARMYGFNGNFKIVTNRFDVRNNYYDTNISRLKSSARRFHRRIFKSGLTHICWEMMASK